MHRIALVSLLIASSAVASPDPRHVDAIRKAAAEYTKWGKVDDVSRAAPALCDSPRMPSHVRMSQADAGSPHGKKLYYLWASDRESYLNVANPKTSIAVGFSIVKQSFVAVGNAKGGFTAGARKDLFVMTRIDQGDKPGSDDGWIYGTVTPEGQVTSAGRVETCMHCHDDQATHGRLFGLAQP